MTELDQEMLDALRVYDSSLLREPQWGEDFFGIDPFYIALGMDFTDSKQTDKRLCSYLYPLLLHVFVHTSLTLIAHSNSSLQHIPYIELHLLVDPLPTSASKML